MSIINLVYGIITATISVGTQPVDARISADNSTAYVLNYGGGTISEISLSSYTVTATTAVGPQPAALDLDANGNPVVGESGYIATLDKSSLAITSSQQISGAVTALAVSQAQSQVLTSAMSGTGAQQAVHTNATSLTDYTPAFSTGAVSTTPYAQSSISSSLAFPSQLASGIIVSPVINNGFSAAATPTGFQITDLETGHILLTGNTPYPVRGMAIDSAAGYFYFTMPDSNSVVTVPIPTVPLTTEVTFLN